MTERPLVRFHDPYARIRDRAAEWEEALRRCIWQLEWVRPSSSVASFEEELAAYCGVRHAIATASGSAALFLLLRALEIGPGSEVVTVSQTFAATVSAIELVGARPVLVDVERNSYTMDPALALDAVGDKTRAILPVHLYGRPMNIDRLRSSPVPVLEEACQAVGARCQGRFVGSLGLAAAMSFGREKAVAGIGEGGAITTNDDALGSRIRQLTGHGWNGLEHATIGTNMRMDSLAAAVLRVELMHAEADLAARQRIADRYTAALAPMGLVKNPVAPNGDKHGLFVYAIEVENRPAFCDHLKREGIEYRLHYERPVHGWSAFRALSPTSLDATNEVAARVVSLPLRPTLSDEEVERVINAVTAAQE